MKTLITITFFLIVQFSSAQLTIKKSSIDSGGEISQNGNTFMLYTIGEVVLNENTTTSLQISEGFINPDVLKYMDLDDYQLESDISVYPNPTVDIVIIDFNQTSQYEIEIFDNNGRLIATQQTNSIKESIDFSNYPSAQYTLLVKNKTNKTIKTFRIVKR